MRGRRAALGALAGLLVLYGLNSGAYFVGAFNDDARHVLAARSLLEGRYDDLSLPDTVPATNLLPGYPLLLAFPYAACGEVGGRALSVLLSLLAALCAWMLLEKESRAAAVLFALHPMFVRYSGTLMTEPAYLFWTLSSLLWLKRLKRGQLLPFSLWLAFGAWIRPHGFLLMAACLPYAASRAGRKERLRAYAAAAAVFAAPYLRNLFVAGTPASYFDEFVRARGVLGPLGILAVNVLSNLSYYFTAVPRMLAGGLSLPPVLLYPWSVFVWALLVLGLREAGRAKDRRPRLVYVLLIGVFSLFWVNHAERYVLVLVPFLYELVLLPLRRASAPRRRLLEGALLAASLFTVLDGTVRTLSGKDPSSRPPRETVAWVKANTRASDVFVAPYRQSFSYLTGRKTYDYFYYPDPDDFFAFLLSHGVTHVWIDHSRVRIPNTPSRRALLDRHARVMEERLRDSGRFALVYRNPREFRAAFAVVSDPAFLPARAELMDVRRDLGAGRWTAALAKLEALEALEAPLRRLDFLLGTTRLIAGDAGKALPHLKKAAASEPRFKKARVNLCRALRATGKDCAP